VYTRQYYIALSYNNSNDNNNNNVFDGSTLDACVHQHAIPSRHNNKCKASDDTLSSHVTYDGYTVGDPSANGYFDEI